MCRGHSADGLGLKMREQGDAGQGHKISVTKLYSMMICIYFCKFYIFICIIVLYAWKPGLAIKYSLLQRGGRLLCDGMDLFIDFIEVIILEDISR